MWLKIRNKIYLTRDKTFPDSARPELEQLIERLVAKGLRIDGFEWNQVDLMYCNNDIKNLTIECYGTDQYLQELLIQSCFHYKVQIPTFLAYTLEQIEKQYDLMTFEDKIPKINFENKPVSNVDFQLKVLMVPQGNFDGIWNQKFLAAHLEYRAPNPRFPGNSLLNDFQYTSSDSILWRAIEVGNFHLALSLIQAAKERNLNIITQRNYVLLCNACLNKNSDGALEFFKLIIDNDDLLQGKDTSLLVFNWQEYLRYDENTNLKIIEINFDKFLYMLDKPTRLNPQPNENFYLLLLQASQAFIPEQKSNVYSELEAKFFNYCILNNVQFPELKQPLQEYINSLSNLLSTNATAALTAPAKGELSKLASAKVFEQILAAAEEGKILRSEQPKSKPPGP